MPPARTLERVLSGISDANINFLDLTDMLRALGFSERVRGDHHIFGRRGIPEIITLQPDRANAKTYQGVQVRRLIRKYHLEDALDDDTI